MGKLRPLPLLRALVLADCPISEMDDYRLEVRPLSLSLSFAHLVYPCVLVNNVSEYVCV